MQPTRRRRGIAVLAALLLAAPTAGAGPAATSDVVRRAWGFDRGDLQPHPGVRFGVLANGLRYALMRNAVPAGALSARLHVAAGATAQGARQGGYMHLIEHLIFEGSANLPKGALLLMLPPQGLRRFADFNAVTGSDETVYRLDLVKADRRARETALTVMREIGSHLLFDRRNVAGAKAAVLAELAARDTVRDRIVAAQTAFLTPENAAARASITGTAASIRQASGAALRRLYARTYVPQRTTLVLVGDFDPVAVEAEIVARFADWNAPAVAPSATGGTPTAAAPGRSKIGLFVDPAAPTDVVIAAVGQVGGADAVGQRDIAFLQHLGAEMLNRRLSLSASGAAAPFAQGSASIYGDTGSARIARIDLAARDRDWRRALQAGAEALGRALEAGFSQAELDAQLAVSRAALLADAAPRTSAGLADGIADAVGRGIVFTAPADPSAAVAYLERIGLTEVNAAFRAAWSRPERFVFVTHNRRVPGAEAAIAAAWTDAMAGPVR